MDSTETDPMTKAELVRRNEALEAQVADLQAKLCQAQEIALRLLQQGCNPPHPQTSIPWYPPVSIPSIWYGDIECASAEITYTTNAKPGEAYRYVPSSMNSGKAR